MAYPRQIRNFNAFLDGISYFGIATEAKMPDPKIRTAAHRGSGMDAPVGVDMGMEGMSAELTFAEWNPVVLAKLGRNERLVLRPAAMGEGNMFDTDTIIVTVGGLITTHEFGALKPGEPSTLKMMIDLRYYRFEHNGEELWEIDIEAGKRVIGGVDQLAEIRRAMGI
ncbi:MAG: phage major tail tube protein [Rhodobacteraceae bacterium]|nr:phage major tail tube protein [Paracoccaceae bacterium]